MRQQISEETEDYVRPDYGTRTLLRTPVQLGKLTLRAWHLLVAVIYVVWLYVYFKTAAISIWRFYELNFWVYGWGPVLGTLLLVFNTNRAQRFLTYLGWFYLLRGPDEKPIMDLSMGVTARRVVRFLNALALTVFFWGLEYALFRLAGAPASWVFLKIYLGLKFPIYLAILYAIFTLADTAWQFRRTRMAGAVSFLLWLGVAAAFGLFLNVVHMAACPDWLCPTKVR